MKPSAFPFILVPVVLLALWLPRGLALDRFVTVDEPKWLMRSANFYHALSQRQFAYTFQREHPGVTVTWAGTAGFFWRFRNYVDIRPGQIERPGRLFLFLRNRNISALELLVAGRTFMVLGIVATLGAAFLVALRLLRVLPALLAFLLIALDPFSIALSRLLHLDGLVSALMFLSILAFAGYLYWGRRGGYLLLSAIAAGLARLTKSPAFFLAPFFGFMSLVGWWNEGRSQSLARRFSLANLWRIVSPLLLWFLVDAVVFVLLWPAMWVDPLGSLSSVFSLASTYASEGHDSRLFFGGMIYDIGQSPWHFYPVAYVWRATPVALIGLVLALIALIFPRRLPLRTEWRRLAVVLLLFALLFILFLSLSAKKFDRYLLPIFAPLDLVAALGWSALIEALWRWAAGWHAARTWTRAARAASAGLLASAVVLVQLSGVLQTYPYYFNYYNPLLGGPEKAVDVMMVGWGEGLDQAAKYLNEKPNAESLKVISWSADGCFSYFFRGSAATIDYDMGIANLRRADYVVLYLNQWQRQVPTPKFLAFFEQFPPEYVVHIGDLEYARIYDMSQAPPEDTAATGVEKAGAPRQGEERRRAGE
jgi:hypothetical protein